MIRKLSGEISTFKQDSERQTGEVKQSAILPATSPNVCRKVAHYIIILRQLARKLTYFPTQHLCIFWGSSGIQIFPGVPSSLCTVIQRHCIRVKEVTVNLYTAALCHERVSDSGMSSVNEE